MPDSLSAVDIIIPIYNAYEDLQICIKSIFSYTDLNLHRLILINDASSDGRISPYLKTLSSNNVLIIENEKNVGFSNSINRGIEFSCDRDVILLNSDTVVTSRWAEKMITCAYSDGSIATVTPLSNNATLTSIPEFLKENSLPDQYTLEQYADLVEKVSLCLYPQIPVANGFCMYIKRSVFNKIGLFDAKTFGRGYGEENDFCYRAAQVGYYHVMCDNTFIYHIGSISFADKEKQKYVAAHEKILGKKYPEQNKAVELFCRDNPNFKVQDNIRLWQKLRNGKKNLLYLVQEDFRKDVKNHFGGTQLHVKDLCEELREDYNIFVAARNENYLNLTAYIGKSEFRFLFYIGPTTLYEQFRNKNIAALFGRILDIFSIALVHIHHTITLTLELYYESRNRNIPVITTIHDYYKVCPTIKLINNYGKLCIGNASPQMCSECLNSRFNIVESINYIDLYRKEHFTTLEMSEVIIVPSIDTKENLLQYFPTLVSKIQVIEHGLMPMKPIERNKSKNFNVAFLGGIGYEKGSRNYYQLVTKGPDHVMWYLFGAWGYNELTLLERKNYVQVGLYERENLPELFQKYQIDLVCVLPIWPETFCYTISEAIMCGIPVIATNIGAIGERVKRTKCGWLVSVESAFIESAEIINRIKDKGAEYQAIVENLSDIKMKLSSEMADEYRKIYNCYLALSVNWKKTTYNDYRWILSSYYMGNREKRLVVDNDELIPDQVLFLEKELQGIKNSLLYKCLIIIAKINIPGKKQLKKILYKIYNLVRLKDE